MVCPSQSVSMVEVTKEHAPGQGYPWDLGICYTLPLGGYKQVTLDIENVRPPESPGREL